MKIIKYKQSEFLTPWKWRKKKPLHLFILQIPYGLYFSVVPGFKALNDLLNTGGHEGGMGTGVMWEPFQITKDEYSDITEAWKTTNLKKILKYKEEDIPDLNFIFDDEILSITKHLDYLSRSREKYESKFWKK